MADDAEQSRTFYEQLFGWTFERTDRLGRPYFIARAGSAAVAGMAQVERRRPDEPIAQWISYLSVSNVDSVVAGLTAAGGRVLVAPTDIQASRAAVVVDPQGAPFWLVRLGPNLNRHWAGRRRSSAASSGETASRRMSSSRARSTPTSRGSRQPNSDDPTRSCSTS
jgi:predicted enzyme related to lactoylglutathione lyase